jgi:prepilin-type N-terminal cleavage/methylation domain-containing protein
MQITQYAIRNLSFAAPKGRRTDTRHEKGFTLVELLVALIVSSIILAAVATLAFAMSTANVSTDDTGIKQAQVRFATLRISELIRHCKLIYAASDSDLAIWRADDDNDARIDLNEIVYIRKGPDSNYLHLYEFPSSSEGTVSLDTMPAPVGDDIRLVPECNNVEFSTDAEPPNTKYVSISFDLVENDVVKHYQINNALHCWAGNLLNEAGDAIVSDDD